MAVRRWVPGGACQSGWRPRRLPERACQSGSGGGRWLAGPRFSKKKKARDRGGAGGAAPRERAEPSPPPPRRARRVELLEGELLW